MAICASTDVGYDLRMSKLLSGLDLYGRTAQRRHAVHNNAGGGCQCSGELFLDPALGSHGGGHLHTAQLYFDLFCESHPHSDNAPDPVGVPQVYPLRAVSRSPVCPDRMCCSHVAGLVQPLFAGRCGYEPSTATAGPFKGNLEGKQGLRAAYEETQRGTFLPYRFELLG